MEKQQAIPDITLKPVTSSQISAIGYDATTKTMAIRFNKGIGVYHYAGVEPDVFDAMVKAKSVGAHFGQHVRGKFQHTLIKDKKA